MKSRLVISRITLNGFKSFPSKTEVLFEKGVTAIVGPNGCGKSNICEAVSWVLGSQSPREFRSQQMVDLIFSGSKGKKAVGMAEVAITFHAIEGDIPGGGDQLVISRRVFREGGSEYRMDGKVVRLKDLLDFLHDSGFRYSSYAIIEQGKIEFLLQMKGSERRQLIEEAAGIARFREKKRQTILKLEETRMNLQRIDDILSEKEKMLRSLKIQAGRARRYRELHDRERELYRQVLVSQYQYFEQEKKVSEKKYSDVQYQESNAAAELAGLEKKLAEGEHRTMLWNNEFNTVDRGCSDRRALIEKSQSLMEVLSEQRTAIGKNRSDLKEEQTGIKNRADTLRKEGAKIKRNRDRLATELDKLQESYDTEDKKAKTYHDRADELRESQESLRAGLFDLFEERKRANEALIRFQGESEYTTREKARISSDSERLDLERKRNTNRIDELKNECAVLDQDIGSLSDRMDETAERVGFLQKEVSGLEKEEVSIRTRLKDLYAEEKNLKPKVAALEKARYLPYFLKLPEDWESFADAVFFLLARATEEPADPGLFLRPTEKAPREIPNAKPLSACLDVSEDAPEWLLDSLPGIYLTEPEHLDRLSSEYWEILFFAASGEVAWGGLRGKPPYSIEEGKFSVALRYESICRKTEKFESTLKNTVMRLQQLKGSLISEEQTLQELRVEMGGKSERKNTWKAEHDLLLEKSQADIEMISQLDNLLERLEEQDQILAGNVNTEQEKVKQLDEQIRQCRESLENVNRELEDNQKTLSELNNYLEKERNGLHAERVQLLKAEEEIRHIESQLNAGEERNKAVDDSLAGLALREKEIAQSLEEHQKIITVNESDLGDLLEQREKLFENGKELKVQKEQYESEVKKAREKLDRIRQEMATAGTDLEIVRVKLHDLIQRCHEAFQKSPGQLGKAQLEQSLEDSLKTLDSLRTSIQKLGAVNLIAEEEFQQLTDDIELIKREKDDLVGSLNGLSDTAKDLERTARSLFLETFEKVNGYFNGFFVNLFGGGQAQLKVLDDEDPLESGVDVYTQPPGKRLQNMLLLSGGEKSLVALAFLMALFHFRPSPFIVLDEVDAALDDANVERFLNLIREVQKHTQVILITHNRRTMELADVLLGITMEEPGCSKVVTLPALKMA